MKTYEKVKDMWVHYAVTQLKIVCAHDKMINQCLDRVDLLTELAELPFEFSAPALWFVTGNGIPEC